MVTTGALNECFIDTFDSFHVLLIHWYVDFSCCCCLVASVMSDRLCVTLWTVACQAPLSMGFSRQEYWSGVPCPPPGDLPDPRIKPTSPALQAGSLPLSYQGSPQNDNTHHNQTQNLNYPLLGVAFLTFCPTNLISSSFIVQIGQGLSTKPTQTGSSA